MVNFFVKRLLIELCHILLLSTFINGIDENLAKYIKNFFLVEISALSVKVLTR